MPNFSLAAIQFHRVARPRRMLRDLTFTISGRSTFVTLHSIVACSVFAHSLTLTRQIQTRQKPIHLALFF